MTEMKVPFNDVSRNHALIRDKWLRIYSEVFDSGQFIGNRGNKYVEQFEKEFAGYESGKHCVAVSSGYAALECALRALDVGPKDEVITVPNTFFATGAAISRVGANPFFVDIDSRTALMDPNKLEECISKDTKAVVPVHLFGQACDMSSICDLAEANSAYVLADACQAHGTKQKDVGIGSLGDIVAYSFYPGKNLGADGDGGAIVTDNPDLAEAVRLQRAYGEFPKNTHTNIGGNLRMDGPTAALLSLKLQHLDNWTADRRNVAQIYQEGLADIEELQLPHEGEGNKHVYHLFVVRTPKRDELKSFLGKHGVQSGIHYSTLIPDQEAYNQSSFYHDKLTKARQAVEEGLSLPIFGMMRSEEAEYVVDNIRNFFKK